MDDMHLLFYLGAAAIVLAMGVTVATTHEPSSLPKDVPATPATPNHTLPASAEGKSAQGFFGSLWGGIKLTPNQWVLCLAHSFTWFGLMCMYIFFAIFVPKYTFGAFQPGSPIYVQGVQWASLGLAVLNLACFLFSPFIDRLCNRFGNKMVHSMAQLGMAIGLVGIYFLHTPAALLGWMALIGIGWATTLSVPFAMLASQVPKGKEGILMGIFNIFVAAPGLLCSLAVGPLISTTGMGEGLAFLLGGIAMVCSVALLQRFNPNEEIVVMA